MYRQAVMIMMKLMIGKIIMKMKCWFKRGSEDLEEDLQKEYERTNEKEESYFTYDLFSRFY